MKLDSSTPGLTPNTLQKNGVQFAAQGNNAPSTPLPASTASDISGDNVHLSPASATLMASANDSSNDIDFDRVVDIKNAIANGTLRIDPAKIADGLILTTQELIQYQH
jgi:negative regulator of flagellin synthesis FlgM